MEILSNIWTALSTPNEGLINIISVPLSFIEIALTMYMFIYVLNVNATNKQKLSYVLCSIIIGLVSNNIVPSPFNIIVNYIVSAFIISKIFKLTILKGFLSMFIPAIVSALLSVLFLNPFLTLCHITLELYLIIPIYRFIYSFFIYILLFCINLSLKYKQITLLILDELDNKSKIIIFSNFILGFIAIVSHLIINFYYLNTIPVIISIVSFLTLFVYFGISIYSITRVTKLIIKTKELESAEAYNKSLSILHDSVRGFKHDFDNIVATIGGFIKTNDMTGLKKYYLELEEDCQKVNNIATLNPNLINNPGIFNLLSSKYHEADSKNIKINLDFFLDLNTLNMKIYEFSRIIGILLDNAIEEAEKCDERIINIIFRNEYNKNRQIVSIENTYTNKAVDINSIFNKGISGKENHSGLGLWEIKQILKKNNNLNLYTSKDNKFFKQQLEIYYK